MYVFLNGKKEKNMEKEGKDKEFSYSICLGLLVCYVNLYIDLNKYLINLRFN